LAAPAQTTNRVPLEVYLRTSWEPDAEYVDGVIEERPMGEWNHADWQAAVVEFFRNYRKEWNIRVAPELRVQVRPGNFRVPDVTILDRNLPIEQIVTHPPLAVIEILSPEDTLPRVLKKLREYQQMGIQTILVLNPDGDDHYQFSAFGLAPLKETALNFPGSSCRFDLDEIKRLLD
jgi:Uma2 family endonuclease